MGKHCIIPGCQNAPHTKLGACRKHDAAVRALIPRVGAEKGARVLATRISDGAKAKLEEAGKGTPYRSAYLVACRLLESIPPKDIAKYLEPTE